MNPRRPVEFDQDASIYRRTVNRSVQGFGETTDYFARLKVDLLAEMAQRGVGPAASLKCLDVGCGIGVAEPFLVERFASVGACDPSPAMLAEASRSMPQVQFRTSTPGASLPYEDGAFDVTFTACTLHHIPAPEQPAFMRTLVAVTRPGGLVAAFEHNPYNPLTRRVVAGCEFDRDAVLIPPPRLQRLFADAGLTLHALWYYIFFPAPLRALRPLERWLRACPLGGQYVVAGRRTP